MIVFDLNTNDAEALLRHVEEFRPASDDAREDSRLRGKREPFQRRERQDLTLPVVKICREGTSIAITSHCRIVETQSIRLLHRLGQ